jgi:hypothetical protein
MKFYAEILHPDKPVVLWHYFLEAPNKESATNAVNEQIIREHSDGFLLDTGGFYILVIEEDND